MMRRHCALTVVLASVACCGGKREQPLGCAQPSWRRVQAADSALALCVPPGFARSSSGHGWARGTADQINFLWLAASVLDSMDATREWGSPPTPPSMRAPIDSSMPDFVRADSVEIHEDTVDGHVVAVETGLLTGGAVGFHRAPAVRAVWRLPRGRWALLQGFATQPGQLDTLRAMMRTVHAR